jgi:ubiquinone/menaquinone biosynthesis C-methylase UbiE
MVVPKDGLEPKTWGLLWDSFGARLVELLAIEEGANVLDVGTGGGSTLYPAVSRVGLNGRVTGIETCEGCFKSTNAEIQRCNVNNAKVLFMDGNDMSFENGIFDYVIAGFIGWSDFFDFENLESKKQKRIVGEIKRVMKPGGRVGLSVWTLQEDTELMGEILREHSQTVEDVYSRENEDGWTIILSKAGFKDIRFITETYGFAYSDLEEWWEEMLDYGWQSQIERMVSEEQFTWDSIKSDVLTSVRGRLNDKGGLPYSRTALFILATK